MSGQTIIAESTLEIAGTSKKMKVILYQPSWNVENNAWGCRFEVTSPISASQTIYGVDSIHALVLALKVLSSHLYGSDLYRNREIGLSGDYGGNLGIPAIKDLLDIAPYPF